MRARIGLLLALAAMAASACGGSQSSPATPTARPMPSPVTVRQEPEGIALADPAFEALAGAHADFGRLGGAVYQIEMPDAWNGRLVLYMHGYGELGPEAQASAPGIRAYLIKHGYAWGASSFSSTSSIPGRSADETAALWDFFTQKYGRPTWTYVTGQSMGGAASEIAAERYADRFDGALGLCGSAGQTDGVMYQADFFTAAAYVAGVTQPEFDASENIGNLVQDRILPALEDPEAHARFEDIMLDLTGGPRAFDREGFHFEEETNWRRSQIVVAAGLAPNAETNYELGPASTITSEEYNRNVVRLRVNDDLMRTFTQGEDTTGELGMPLLSLHTTGDGQSPIEQARIYQRRVGAAGKSELLVQRVFRDAGHCGFTYAEWEANLEALVAWVEHGDKPEGEDVLVDDLQTLGGQFELTPRLASESSAVVGAQDRAVLRGTLTLDGAPFDSRWVGAIVRKDGLVTPCQYTLPPVDHGRYEISVFADTEQSGCGSPGAEVILWTFAQDQRLFSREAVAWPGNGGTATFDATFSASTPLGASLPVAEFIGDVFNRDNEHMPPGTRVEAYAGDVLCGVASTHRTGSYSGYILSVAGADSVPGCERGTTLTFRLNGEPAVETSVNDIERANGREPLNLTLR